MNKLWNEDCIKTMHRTAMYEAVDLIVTSPPYDKKRDYHSPGKSFDFHAVANTMRDVLKLGGVAVWIVADQTKNFAESLTSFKQAIYFVEVAGFKLLDTMIYEKVQGPAVNASMCRFNDRFEFIFVLVKGNRPKTWNPKMKPKTYRLPKGKTVSRRGQDGRLIYDVIDYPAESIHPNVLPYVVSYGNATKDKEAYEHPAIMPEALAADMIEAYSNPSDLVYDPFAGSGTTLKMARLLGRNYAGSEISPEYCAIARQRIRKVK